MSYMCSEDWFFVVKVCVHFESEKVREMSVVTALGFVYNTNPRSQQVLKGLIGVCVLVQATAELVIQLQHDLSYNEITIREITINHNHHPRLFLMITAGFSSGCIK